MPSGLRNLEHSYDLELTYTSNAIEFGLPGGNILKQLFHFSHGEFRDSLCTQIQTLPGPRLWQQALRRVHRLRTTLAAAWGSTGARKA